MPVLNTHQASQTKAFGEALAKQLKAGDVLLLRGDLGAGKSELARGIARGLGDFRPCAQPKLYHFAGV